MSGNMERRYVEDDVVPVETQTSLGQDQNQGQTTTTEERGASPYYCTELRLEKRWRVGVYEKELELKVAREQYEDLKSRYEKSKQKQRDLRTTEKKLLTEIATLRGENRMRDTLKNETGQQDEAGNQRQSIEFEVLTDEFKKLKRSTDEEKTKVKELKQKQKNLKSKEKYLKQVIQQLGTEGEQNDALQNKKDEMKKIHEQLQTLGQDVQKAVDKEKKMKEQQEKVSSDLRTLASGQQVANKKIQDMYESIDQVRSMYREKIEDLRKEMNELTSGEKLQKMREADGNMTLATSDEPVLLHKIRPFFICCVHPLNVLYIIKAHDPKVLVEQDIQQVQCTTNNHGSIQGAAELLTRLVRYEGWLSCIVNVLRDPNVQLNHVADKIEDLLENSEDGEQGDLTKEVKTFWEAKDRHNTQLEKLREDMKSKEEQHKELEKKIQSYKTENEKLRQEKTELEEMQARTLPVTGFKAQTTCALYYITIIENYHTVETNYGGHFNPVTGDYTIPVDGRYHVTFSHDHRFGFLRLYHLKVSEESYTTICNNKSSPFDKGVKQATHECVMCRGDTLYVKGYSKNFESKMNNVTVRFSVSYLG